MKKIISSIIGIAMFALFAYYTWGVLTHSFVLPEIRFDGGESTPTVTRPKGDLDGGELRVKSIVTRLNGTDKLKNGASICLDLGSRGYYTINKTNGAIMVSESVGNCDVEVGINGDYFVNIEASDDPCRLIRNYYNYVPKLAWLRGVKNVTNACTLGYIEAYNACFSQDAEVDEKDEIKEGCAM